MNSSGPCDNDDEDDNDDDYDDDDDDDDDDCHDDDEDILAKLILKLLFQSTVVPFRLVWEAAKCLILHFKPLP